MILVRLFHYGSPGDGRRRRKRSVPRMMRIPFHSSELRRQIKINERSLNEGRHKFYTQIMYYLLFLVGPLIFFYLFFCFVSGMILEKIGWLSDFIPSQIPNGMLFIELWLWSKCVLILCVFFKYHISGLYRSWKWKDNWMSLIKTEINRNPASNYILFAIVRSCSRKII